MTMNPWKAGWRAHTAAVVWIGCTAFALGRVDDGGAWWAYAASAAIIAVALVLVVALHKDRRDR